MSKVLLFLIFFIQYVAGEPRYYEFNYHTNNFRFELPDLPYKEQGEGYGEGRFILLNFADGSGIVVHCGGAVVRPFLKSRKHKLRSCKEVDGVIVRNGFHRDNRLFWQENFYKEFNLTIYFVNVSASNLEAFERTLSSVVRTERRQ